MKRKIILTSIFLIGTQLLAIDSKYFVGMGLNKTTIDSSVSAFGSSVSNEVKDTSLELKLGVILENTNKIYLSYSKIHKENIDIKNFLLNYNYLFENKTSFTPYLGIYSGLADSELKGTFTSEGSSIVAGLKAGVLYMLTENIDLETSFSYSKYYKDEKVKMLGTEIANSSARIDNSNNFYFGINYKF